MAENTVEIPLLLENVLRYSLNDAKARMEKGEEVVPFTALAVGETLFMEEQDADSVEECFENARRTVSRAKGASAYGFCYDGYVDADTGRIDAIIAQGGVPGDPYGHAIGITYRVDAEGNRKFNAEPIYVGPARNYMDMMEPPAPKDAEEAEEGEAAAGAADGEGEETPAAE